MKKFLALILALATLSICLISCKSEDKEETTGDTSEKTSETSTTEASFDPNAVALSSEHFEITNAMLSYFFYSNYYSEMNQNGSLYQQYGLDTSASLKDQTYPGDSTKSWYDYFMEGTVTNIKDVLYFLEAEYDEGKSEDEIDKTQIDTFISSLSEQADSADSSLEDYISEYFGKGLTEDILRKALEYYTRAYTYYNNVYLALKFSEEDCQKYFDENTSEFMLCDYMFFTYKADLPESDANATTTAEVNTSDPEVQAAYEAAKKNADALAAKNGSEDEFREALKQALSEKYMAENAAEPDTETLAGLLDSNFFKGALAIGEDSERQKWTAEDDRKAGDTIVIDNGSGSYSVYYMVRPAYRDESATKNLRYALFIPDNHNSSAEEARKAADEAYEEWKSGDATEDSFSTMVAEKSEDTSNASTGGLVQNITAGTFYDAFDEWCFDESRKEGDTVIIDSTYGSQLCYYISDGLTAWVATASDALRSQKLQELHSKYSDKYEITEAEKLPSVMD